MWFWIFLILLFIGVEETIYYAWNRYVYGPNFEGKRKWWNGLKVGLVWLKQLFHKRDKNSSHSNSDKGTPL
ncbi:hypothetical protein [Neobacillus drentensis]|uniref:hypothetical protein n=1 Tax=Neobacillus drentensis TaxID=220684 RepID=UPI002FFE37D6